MKFPYGLVLTFPHYNVMVVAFYNQSGSSLQPHGVPFQDTVNDLKSCAKVRLQAKEKDVKIYLSHDVTSGSYIMPCINIDKPQVVYILSNMT